VVVPLPAGKGYQALNAQDLERAGGAVIIDQEQIGDVPGLLSELIADPDRLEAMRGGAHSVAKPDSARRVAAIIKEVAGV
jgi:UDP-N-acetylglucosamine:LPS N-acetylglucosamine transferase